MGGTIGRGIIMLVTLEEIDFHIDWFNKYNYTGNDQLFHHMQRKLPAPVTNRPSLLLQYRPCAEINFSVNRLEVNRLDTNICLCDPIGLALERLRLDGSGIRNAVPDPSGRLRYEEIAWVSLADGIRRGVRLHRWSGWDGRNGGCKLKTFQGT